MKGGKVALAAMIAAGAGYLSGLLTAPRSGQQTRKKIAKSASKTMTDGEKQLKKLYTEINSSIKQAEGQVTQARTKANNELKQAIASAREARQKARLILTALHEGDADDPNLKAVLQEVSTAKKHLSQFIKSSLQEPPQKSSSSKQKSQAKKTPRKSTKAAPKGSSKSRSKKSN